VGIPSRWNRAIDAGVIEGDDLAIEKILIMSMTATPFVLPTGTNPFLKE